MKLPKLRVLQSERQTAEVFRGYNHNLRIGDSEFYDMQNMTSDHYPVLSTRAKRGLRGELNKPVGLISKGELCWVEDGVFYIGGYDTAVDMGLSNDTKTMVSMGAYVIILPDKKWVNTAPDANGEYAWGEIDAEFDVKAEANGEAYGKVAISNCDENGEELSAKEGMEAPQSPNGGDLWLDTSSYPPTVKKYFSGSQSWGAITSYIKIQYADLADRFDVGDSVLFDGFSDKQLNDTHTLCAVNKEEGYVLIKGACKNASFQDEFTAKRKMPDLDFITECNNRLWGCKYGETEDGTFVNQIYASKLGDFKNWNCFDGISTDSYTASCGSDGPFTGAITHLGCPLFFKENGLHKVYGDYPSNFQIQYTPCRGVQQGCHKSLAVVGETLFYKSRNAVCAYDGSLPVEISADLGDDRYYNAVAGAHGNKYYINMQDSPGGVYHLFVYDTAKGIWHKEDNIRLDCFCSHLHHLYAVKNRTKEVLIMYGADAEALDEMETEPVPWMVETGIWGMSSPDMKYISRLMIRMSLDEGASVEVSIQYDSSQLWEQVCVMSATSLRSFSIPVRPKRCDHFRIQIKGEGQCRIFSITKTMEQGSDIS